MDQKTIEIEVNDVLYLFELAQRLKNLGYASIIESNYLVTFSQRFKEAITTVPEKKEN